MRSRAVRRLQESVRLVREALQAMTDTPRAPHPNFPGRPRLQRPAYEEPIAIGTLPKFIETPTIKPKTVRFETQPSESAGQSAKRQRQEEEPSEKSSSSSSSSSSAERSPMDLREPPEQKQTRCLSPAGREDSKQKRQRPSEVNGVLTLAGVYSGDEVAAWTEDQHTKRRCRKYETWKNLERWSFLIGHKLDKFFRHVACTNNDWTVHIKCELWHEVLSKQSVRTQILCWYSKTHHFSESS